MNLDKIRPSVKYVAIVLLLFLLILIPISINIAYKYDFNIWWIQSEWSAGEALVFYGSILSLLGTLVLGATSIWQTKKSYEVSQRMLDKDLMDSACFMQLQNKFDIVLKENSDLKITHSAYHKLDYGATILIESYETEVEKYNEYLCKLYFINSYNKNIIKKVKLVDVICVQDPEEGCLFWEDGSNDPIPLGLNINFSDNVYLNWNTNTEFYVQMKIYCEPDKCFDSMIKNKANLCLIFSLKIDNLYGVESEMSYKIWLKKNEKVIRVINTNSTLKNISVKNE